MKLISRLAIVAVAFGGALFAQANAGHITVHFQTPVIVGETPFPAGDCEIQALPASSDSNVLVVRSESGAHAAVLVNRTSGAHTDVPTPTVVLARRGEDLYLHRIIFPDGSGFQVNAQ
jgi:hypothetical protein